MLLTLAVLAHGTSPVVMAQFPLQGLGEEELRDGYARRFSAEATPRLPAPPVPMRRTDNTSNSTTPAPTQGGSGGGAKVGYHVLAFLLVIVSLVASWVCLYKRPGDDDEQGGEGEDFSKSASGSSTAPVDYPTHTPDGPTPTGSAHPTQTTQSTVEMTSNGYSNGNSNGGGGSQAGYVGQTQGYTSPSVHSPAIVRYPSVERARTPGRSTPLETTDITGTSESVQNKEYQF